MLRAIYIVLTLGLIKYSGGGAGKIHLRIQVGAHREESPSQ